MSRRTRKILIDELGRYDRGHILVQQGYIDLQYNISCWNFLYLRVVADIFKRSGLTQPNPFLSSTIWSKSFNCNCLSHFAYGKKEITFRVFSDNLSPFSAYLPWVVLDWCNLPTWWSRVTRLHIPTLHSPFSPIGQSLGGSHDSAPSDLNCHYPRVPSPLESAFPAKTFKWVRVVSYSRLKYCAAEAKQETSSTSYRQRAN